MPAFELRASTFQQGQHFIVARVVGNFPPAYFAILPVQDVLTGEIVIQVAEVSIRFHHDRRFTRSINVYEKFIFPKKSLTKRTANSSIEVILSGFRGMKTFPTYWQETERFKHENFLF